MTDQQWDLWMEECQEKAELCRRSPSNQYLPLAGVMPTLFLVAVHGIHVFDSYDIKGLRSGDRIVTPVNEPTSRPWAYFNDIADMCMGSINKGYVFRQPMRQVSHYSPDVGRYVRKGSKWKWEVLQNFDWNLLLRHRTVTADINGDPQVTWDMYYSL
ncbi:hypothetical protein ACG7TL_002462 [Trametes sanguinea]